MSGADYLAVLLLAGFVIITCAFDSLRTRRNRKATEPCDCWICRGTRQHQRQCEMERLP